VSDLQRARTAQEGDRAGQRVRPDRHEPDADVKTDRELLGRAKRYDTAALGELYDHHAPRIYAYLYRQVRDPHLAEDLTGDVFVRMLGAIRSERFWQTSFQAWLYRIAHNLVVDHYRRASRTSGWEADEVLMVTDDDVTAAVATRLAREQLGAAIRRLTPDQQQVLTLRFGAGMTARETARVVDKSVGAVEALQHRALVALRRLLEQKTFA
jgi:RNA polymerase sigma-70 factor (ECF subfamily)